MDALQGAIVTALNPASYSNKQKQDLHQELTQVLHRYPSLTIRCYSHKVSTLSINLAQLEGILSLFYKKVKYNIPIILIYPQNYPLDAPSLYVTPSSTMVLNMNNKKVDQSGKISLNALNKWKKKPATCLILEEAKELFEKDIPIFSTSGVVQLQSYPQQTVPTSSGLLNSAYVTANGFVKSVEQAFNGNSRLPGSQVAPSNRSGVSHPPAGPSASSSSSGKAGLSSLFGEKVAVGLAVSQSSNQPSKKLPDLPLIKQTYLNRMKSLRDEIGVLSKERETLNTNSSLIQKDLLEYSGQIEKTLALKTLLKSNVSNTEDWLIQSRVQNTSEVQEEDLIEFRNDYAKEYLKTLASEKAFENTVQVLIDSMHKNHMSFKEGVPQIKSLFIEIFLASRLKEKFLALSS